MVVVEGGEEGGRGRGGSLLSFSLLFSLPALVVSLSSLNNNDNDRSSSRALSLSLGTHGL